MNTQKNNHIRQPNDESFLLEIGDKKYIYIGEKVIYFETIITIVKSSSKLGFNDTKYPYVFGEGNICFMLHQKYTLFKNVKLQ